MGELPSPGEGCVAQSETAASRTAAMLAWHCATGRHYDLHFDRPPRCPRGRSDGWDVVCAPGRIRTCAELAALIRTNRRLSQSSLASATSADEVPSGWNGRGHGGMVVGWYQRLAYRRRIDVGR